MKRFFRKLITFFFIPYVPWLLFIHGCKEFYLYHEYGMWRYSKEVSLGEIYPDKNFDYIVLGDSRSVAAYDSKEISEKFLSLAVGGATPIEMYYALKNYLENHRPPKKIFLSIIPRHVSGLSLLYERSFLFNYLNLSQRWEVFNEMSRLNSFIDSAATKREGKIDFWYYFLTVPLGITLDYQVAVRNGLFVPRIHKFNSLFSEIVAQRGHYLYGQAKSDGRPNGDIALKDKSYMPLMVSYLEKILALVKDSEIHYIHPPMNQASYEELPKREISDFFEILKKYKNKLSSIEEELLVYPDQYFGDSSHLNQAGSKKFSNYIKRRYVEE